MKREYKFKNLPKKCILIVFVIFILMTYFSKILLCQKYQAKKIQSSQKMTSLMISFDSFCIIHPFSAIFQIPPLGNIHANSYFSRQEVVIAKPIFSLKRLINQYKSFVKSGLLLLKYRFLEVKKSLEEIQAKKSEGLKLLFPPDNLRFIRGLVLGEKSQNAGYLPGFENAGMLHVLVASGFNIALVGSLAWILVKKREKETQILTVLGSIWAYAAYLNFEPPLLRAAWMFSLVILLKHGGIQTKRIRILIFSVAMILLVQPDLISSLSLWLSALATLGILIFSRRLSFFWQESQESRTIVGILLEEAATSFSAQALIFPLLVWFFQSVNLVSFIANPFMLPWLGTITQLSGLEILLSFLDRFWLIRVVSGMLTAAMNQVFATYFWAVEWWQHFFFLNFSPTSGEMLKILLLWMLAIIGFLLFSRIKQEKKRLFFHEKA